MAIAECNKLKYSSYYNGHTNKSFKKLTDIEKKQCSLLGMIHRAKNKAKILKDLRFISNELLSNCAYHNKNIENQNKKLENLNVPDNEKNAISMLWDLKYNIGLSLINNVNEMKNLISASEEKSINGNRDNVDVLDIKKSRLRNATDSLQNNI